MFVSCVCGPAAVALDVVAAAVDVVAVAAAVVVAAVVYKGRGHRLSPSTANNMVRRHVGLGCNIVI